MIKWSYKISLHSQCMIIKIFSIKKIGFTFNNINFYINYFKFVCYTNDDLWLEKL